MTTEPQDPSSEHADDGDDAADEGGVFDAQAIVDAMGGTRGLLEASIPGVVFAVVYAITGAQLAPSLWTAVIAGAVILVAAIVQRRSVQQTISGFVGILFAAGIVLITGRARDFFLLSLWRNGIWLVAHTVSLIVRWPLIGLLLGPFTGEGLAWRRDRARLHAYMWCTVVWIFVFGLRLAVQFPLFKDDEVVALGFVGVLLGVPLFLAGCLANYLILRRVPLAVRPDADRPDTDLPATDPDDDGSDSDSSADRGGDDPHPPFISPG